MVVDEEEAVEVVRWGSEADGGLEGGGEGEVLAAVEMEREGSLGFGVEVRGGAQGEVLGREDACDGLREGVYLIGREHGWNWLITLVGSQGMGTGTRRRNGRCHDMDDARFSDIVSGDDEGNA